MPARRIVMKKSMGFITGLMVLALLSTIGIVAASDTVTATETTVALDTLDYASTNDLASSVGPIGANNPLYGLKIAWEDLDESFTTNETQLMEKQMLHNRIRLSEARQELAGNRTNSAQQALDLYWQKVNLTQARLGYFSSNETGLLHAQEIHTQNQIILEDLMLSHPNNTGLARAYNNSLNLENKFEVKTQVRFGKIVDKDNQTIMKAYRLEVQEENRVGQGNGAGNETREQIRNEEKIHVTDTTGPAPQKTTRQSDDTNKGGQGKNAVTVTTSQVQNTPQPQNPAGSQGNGNANDDDKGNGKTRGK